MSIKINHELPLPEILKEQYPISGRVKEIKKKREVRPVHCPGGTVFGG